MKKSLFLLFLLLAPMAQAQLVPDRPQTKNSLNTLIHNAEAGDVKSKYKLGYWYMEGIDGLLKANANKGRKLLMAAADAGNADACRMVYKLNPLKNDGYRKMAEESYLKIGTAEAIYKIADMYSNDPASLRGWLKTSSLLGYEKAKQDLQVLHRTQGNGKTFDQWYADIAEKVSLSGNSNTESQPIQSGTIQMGWKSDVDEDIPLATRKNENTIAIVIGNYDYKYLPDVSFAFNDASMFAHYCEATLGIPKYQIHFLENATQAEIEDIVKGNLKEEAKTYPSFNVIFYYAGHGAPVKDQMNGGQEAAYIIATEAMNTESKAKYKIDDLLADLNASGADHITVFMDACFSGVSRDGAVDRNRGIKVKPQSAKTEGNVVMFSACSGDETAWGYEDQSHGYFTYFLLKKLQESTGAASLGELEDFIKTQVTRRSSNAGKAQHPTISASATLGDSWKDWKLSAY